VVSLLFLPQIRTLPVCSVFTLLFSETYEITGDYGFLQTCTFVDNAAAAGELSPEFCAFIPRFGDICGCPQFPNETMLNCALCPATGVQNPYVFCIW
jgi:hypothetical protein